ncbi:MAG TPA: hypothetical protein VIH36_13105 [Casimicrobiaceae bacterium]|jgi:hypothetical protein
MQRAAFMVACCVAMDAAPAVTNFVLPTNADRVASALDRSCRAQFLSFWAVYTGGMFIASRLLSGSGARKMHEAEERNQ